ncbi:MAG: Uma2 family endonuclease [Chloroflexota bacterium]|nr:Uma2 family endonuclease [Chloroflexota bacterium]
MSVKELLTAEDVWAMPDDGKRYELVRGELIEVPGAGVLHSFIVGTIYRLIQAYAGARRLGVAFPDGLGCILYRNPDVIRVPDVSFISLERLPQGGLPEGYCPFAPDLAVEIVSPSDTAQKLHAKVREYLEAGTRIVWVIWPDEHAVSVYTADENGSRELRAEDELSGGDVLPGFRVRVAQLFEQNY